MHTLPLFFGLLWRTIALQLIVSLAILILIGITGADVLHRNEKYILLKPTIIYGAFALALLIGWLGLRVNLVRAMWGSLCDMLEFRGAAVELTQRAAVARDSGAHMQPSSSDGPGRSESATNQSDVSSRPAADIQPMRNIISQEPGPFSQSRKLPKHEA
ncbi:septation protein IspZ [Ralstonia flaminis]|jgi:hypothetical protein|uniref:septation protein IspZ n=1 Tax=Ralstonia flaminis TaxID=3058597 RepID=UPI00292F77AC|nr:septation protein IspZ [Ralstonia sp. LMG 18101]